MILLILTYILIPLGQFTIFMAGQTLYGPWDALNYGSSILALHWMLAHVLLGAKIPLLQRHLPYDQRIRFHILGSLGITAAVAYHATYKLVMGSFISPITWALLVVIASLLVVAVFWIPVPGFKKLRTQVITRLRGGKAPSYDRAKSLHGWFVLGLSTLLWLHIYDSGLFDLVPLGSSILYQAWFALAAGAYLLSKLGVFRVPAILKTVETRQGIVTLELEPQRPVRYKGGQFAFLQVPNAQGKREEHPFSFLSIPGQETLRFAIRLTGDFTRGLADLKPGTRVWINGGFGNFRPRKKQDLCLIASGIGAVPVISLVKELHAKEHQGQVQVHLAVNHEDEIPDREELEALIAQRPNMSLEVLVFNRDGRRWDADYFRHRIAHDRDQSYFVCSSPVVRGLVLDFLDQQGISKKDIHYEEFSFA